MDKLLHPTGNFDNSAKKYDHITVLPLSAAMGAEIQNVNIANINDDIFLEIEDALYRHKMIYFRDQAITHSHQEQFTLRFGEFGEDAYDKATSGHNNVQQVIKEADARTKMIFGSGWHTDTPFVEKPPSISMLYGVDIPPYGGDTMWCNSVLAFKNLSNKMQAVISPLKVLMSGEDVIAAMTNDKIANKEDINLGINTSLMTQGYYHPLVRTHPKTGEKSLYIDRTYSRGIEGMTKDEAMPLVNFLSSFVTQPSFTCRLRWKKHTFVLWDNRICLHQAFNDYDGFRREMYRTMVQGEKPQ